MVNLNFIDMYSALIAAPSISSTVSALDMSNQKVINLLASWCYELGFNVEVSELVNTPGKFNLAAKLGEGEGGLMLAGHTDTVPFDASAWRVDPFSLSQKDNKLFGLGTIDMKGFFAFVLSALQDIEQDAGLSNIKRPLVILATADEETTMAGAIEIAKQKQLKPDRCIIGEPTNMVPIYTHKGHMSSAIRVTGRSGHSSAPDAGLNAIEVMHLVIAELLKLKSEIKNKYSLKEFHIPYPTLNLGHIHGGDNANRICSCCELHLDMRPIPGMSVLDLQAMLLNAVKPINEQYPNAVSVIDLHDPIPVFEGSADSALVKLAEKLSGEKAQAVDYCTEAPFLQQLGCDTIVMGPGSIKQAHQPDEFLAMEKIKPSHEIIKQLIIQNCF
jgi:acetylornithine deacetylase